MTAFNVGGNPALSLCCGYAENGMPFSLQIVGKLFDDAKVCASAMPMNGRRRGVNADRHWPRARPPRCCRSAAGCFSLPDAGVALLLAKVPPRRVREPARCDDLGDIPLTTGQPSQGGEGQRFMGITCMTG